MNWIQGISKALRYVEQNLTEDISVDDVAKQALSSSSHFQLVFHVVTGITFGEYIRNRRLTRAALDMVKYNGKIIDIAMKYGYDTQESFSKAFSRFHGISPSKAHRKNIKVFHPLTVNVTIQGGYEMPFKLIDEFYWRKHNEEEKSLSPKERYKCVTNWALHARRVNPSVFDALTEWILDDKQWESSKILENEQILLQGVFGRFKEQNDHLRKLLSELKDSGVVNEAVFKALDDFDQALNGVSEDERLSKVITDVFEDFSLMSNKEVRKMIAGDKTGVAGVDTVDFFGYINCLKDFDASVQWALFMPDMVKNQQVGFKIVSFEYLNNSGMRFIGLPIPGLSETDKEALFNKLDALKAFNIKETYDTILGHHFGKGVDVQEAEGLWGRFLAPNTPVPEGLLHYDFAPENNGEHGLPYLSQYALSKFEGDLEAMHRTDGYDVEAMYDITRNIILGQGVLIPYPFKYWTAELFLKGHHEPSTAYMFSVEIKD